jgi:hypothetical protein
VCRACFSPGTEDLRIKHGYFRLPSAWLCMSTFGIYSTICLNHTYSYVFSYTAKTTYRD